MQRRLSLVTMVVVGLGFGFAGPVAADEVVRTIDESFTLGPEGVVRLDVPVAEVEIRTTRGDQVELELVISCNRARRCREQAEELTIDSRSRDDRLDIRVEGYEDSGRHHPELELRMTVPETASIDLDLGVGEVDILGTSGDVFVSAGVGDVRVEADEDSVREVALDVGVGDARISPSPRSVEKSGFLFLGNEVRWAEGRGSAEIEVEVGVGEARVVLN